VSGPPSSASPLGETTEKGLCVSYGHPSGQFQPRIEALPLTRAPASLTLPGQFVRIAPGAVLPIPKEVLYASLAHRWDVDVLHRNPL
jgi:hypothetical protein